MFMMEDGILIVIILLNCVTLLNRIVILSALKCLVISEEEIVMIYDF